jgi:hypothetical protein
MQTQNYHTQDGAIHNGYAHIASLALIDLIAEVNKRLDSRVTPEEDSGGLQNDQCAVLGIVSVAIQAPRHRLDQRWLAYTGVPQEQALGLAQNSYRALLTLKQKANQQTRFKAFDPGI